MAGHRRQARQPGPVGEQLTASLPVSFDGTAQPVQAGPIRLFAGLRSDPFFADVEGALHGFAWTGHDDFADNNVDSIALEVPDDMLGAGPVIGVWASISLRRDGTLVQMDRGGNPTINPFINPDGEKNLFNSRQPADDVANYLGPWSKILENSGYPPEEARAAALQVLPDILRYDRSQPATYPNGRVPTDDVYSMRFAWLSNGKVRPAGLKPHDDLLASSPTSASRTPPGSTCPAARHPRAGTTQGGETPACIARDSGCAHHGIPRHHDHPRSGRNPSRKPSTTSAPARTHTRVNSRPKATCSACGARRYSQANGGPSDCSPPTTAMSSREFSPRCRCASGVPMRSPRSPGTRTTRH